MAKSASFLDKACRYCSSAEHCKSEIKEKLYQWQCPREQFDDIISYLEENNYIDEERYCHAYVHDKILFQKWGKIKVRMMLISKQLPDEYICEALDEFNQEDYLNILQQIVDKQLPLLGEEKTIRHCLSHGFTYDDIKSVMNS